MNKRIYHGIGMITSILIMLMFLLTPLITSGQTIKEKPQKPQTQNQLYNTGFEYDVPQAIFNQYAKSSVAGSNSGYWNHLLMQNTGSLPFGESRGYEFPAYWTYTFVDSNNRLFVDAGGLFVRDGSYWSRVTVNGEQLFRVREIVEDDDGTFWVGTYDGLLHLNSSLQLIEEYNTGNSNLKNNDINSLWISNRDSLWIGHRWNENTGGGVSILDELDKPVQVIDSLDGYTADIIQRSNGDIWVAQSPDNQGNNGSIYVYRPSKDSSWAYTDEDGPDGLPHTEIDNFSEDNMGNLWMGTYATEHHPKGGVIKYDGSWTLYDQDENIPQAGGWYTYAVSDDSVYHATQDSVVMFDGTSWSHVDNGSDKFPLRAITIITEDQDGNLLFGSEPSFDAGGIHTYDGSSWDYISSATDNGLFSNVIFGADVDTDGNVWVSGFYGVGKYDPDTQEWTYYGDNDELADTYSWKVLAADNGDVWFSTNAGSPTRLRNGTFTSFENDPAFDEAPFVEASFEDSQGNIWFAAFDSAGVVRYDEDASDQFVNYSSENSGIVEAEYYFAFGQGPNDQIYVASTNGVSTYDGKGWSEFPVDGQTGAYVNEMASDNNNNLWFDIGGTIKKWDGSIWTTFDQSNDGYMGWATHIEPASDGAIWLAGPGIQVIKDGIVYDMTPAAEYGNTISYIIAHDNQGQAWVGTYGNGIFKYEMSDGLTIESVEDHPDDQGYYVTVKPGGFLMNPIPGGESTNAASWAVRKVVNGNWETAGTSQEFSENQMTVDVEKTMPTGEDSEEYKYDFQVVIYDAGGNEIAKSGTVEGYAIDNIAPEVGGFNANRGEDHVVLNWNVSSTSEREDVSYEIVSAEDPEGSPLKPSPDAGTTLYDANFSGIQNLQVRAKDSHNNASELSNPVRAVFPIDLTYDVEASWNLIGLPLDADQAQIDNLLSRIEEGNLYVFDGKYREAETLEPGKGYWAKFEGSSNYDVTGLPLVDNNIDLKEGWNLISGIGQSLNIGDISDPNGILVDGTLSGFNGSYTESSELNLGAGYWVRASEAGTITLSLDHEGSAKSKESMPVIAETKKGLNKIIVSSGDHQRTLYFGNKLPDEVNPLSFSLPPLPPGNAFDARFDKDMGYTESNAFEINLQKKKDAPITIDLELLQTSSHQQFVVQELKGGNVVAEHEMDGDKSVTLQNSDITGIRVATAGNELLNNDIPDKFSLDPSYPNPFNPSTTIQYRLPEQVAVHLEVFNMVGQKVNTLVQGEQQEAGIHKIRFNASSLSSGIYFVRLQAGTFRQIQKITLIK